MKTIVEDYRDRSTRNLRRVVFTIIVLLTVVGPSDFANDIATVSIGFYENRPKIFTNAQGNPAGFWPDIIEYIADKEDWSIRWVSGTWAECQRRLESGEIEIMPDVAFSDERSQQYDFSNETVFVNWGILYARAGLETSSFTDLEGKSIAVMEGSIHTRRIQELTEDFDIDCSFIIVPDYHGVFELLENGTADIGVVNRIFGNTFEHDYQVQRTPIIFNPRELRFALPKGSALSATLIDTLDNYIVQLKSDPNSIYYTSMEKYLAGAVSKPKAVFPAWAKQALIALSFVLVLLIGGAIIPRLQVSRRTAKLTKANEDLKIEGRERKRAKEKLQRHREHLEELVKERTSELEEKNIDVEQANERLKELDRLKSIFLASISHELRTPLNSIIGFTGILLQGISGPLSGEQKKQLTAVKGSGQHLLDLINDLLDVSKIEAGKVKVSVEEFALAGVANEVTEAISPAANNKELDVVTEVQDDIVLLSDRRRIKQVLVNLVSNAVKFTDHGQVTITGKRLENEQVEFQVSDTSIGMKREDVQRLFQPFQQIDESLTKEHEGTGLGLYLCKKIVDLLGGTIKAESEYGKGSEFIVTLPLRHRSEKRGTSEEDPGS